MIPRKRKTNFKANKRSYLPFTANPGSLIIALDAGRADENFFALVEALVLPQTGEKIPPFVLLFDSSHSRSFASMSTFTFGVSTLALLAKWRDLAARLTVRTASWYDVGFYENFPIIRKCEPASKWVFKNSDDSSYETCDH